MRKFYVYIDRKPPSDESPDGEVFYVGKGNESRVVQKRRNKWHSAICAKHPDWTRERVFEGDEGACFEEEMRLIALYGRRDLGLGTLANMSDGGEGPSGAIRSDEVRAKLSAANLGKLPSEKNRAALIAANTGRKMTPENKAKLLAAKIGKPRSEETKAKLSEALKGRPLPQEVRDKMSAARKGKKQSAAQVAARSGWHHSEESKARISASRKARNAADKAIKEAAAA